MCFYSSVLFSDPVCLYFLIQFVFVCSLFYSLCSVCFRFFSASFQSVLICSFCSFLNSFLLSILFNILFFSALLYVPCSVLSLSIYNLFSDLPCLFFFQICYPSLLFSYYSVPSASPLGSVIIQSALILLFFILLRALYLILLCYIICSCFCFIYKPSFQ